MSIEVKIIPNKNLRKDKIEYGKENKDLILRAIDFTDDK